MFRTIIHYFSPKAALSITESDISHCTTVESHDDSGVHRAGMKRVEFKKGEHVVAECLYNPITGQASVLASDNPYGPWEYKDGLEGDARARDVLLYIKEEIKKTNPETPIIWESLCARPHAWESLGGKFQAPTLREDQYLTHLSDWSDIIPLYRKNGGGTGGGYHIKINE